MSNFSFSTWVASGWIHLAIGFALGWLVFKRPDIMTKWIEWIKEKIKFW